MRGTYAPDITLGPEPDIDPGRPPLFPWAIGRIQTLREQLWRAGLRPVAVYNVAAGRRLGHEKPGKQPFGNNWQLRAQRTPPEAATAPIHPDATNTGLWCGGLRVFDFDIDNPTLARACRLAAYQRFGKAPTRYRDGSPRCAILYRAADGEPAKAYIASRLGKVEVLGRGQQIVAFGDHESGAELKWNGDPRTDDIPAITEHQVTDYLAWCANIIGADPPRPKDGNGTEHAAGEPQADPLRISDALHDIPNNGPPDWEWWNRIAMAVWRATGGSPAGWEMLNAWSARNPAYDAAETRKRWDHYRTTPPHNIGAGTIFYIAKEARDRWQQDRSARQDAPAPDDDNPRKKKDGPRKNQDSIALEFTTRHRDKLRYCHHTGKWHVWTGAIWKPEETMLAFDFARVICRDLGGNKLTKAMDAGAVERFARADRAFAVTSELWDRDKYLLGTPGGTVDLKTGALRPARQEDYITRSTSVTPTDTPDCPLWLELIDQVTLHVAELRAFLQRWFGYCLTGDTGEHSLLFCYGTGGNGKGVTLNTIATIMGDYAKIAPMDTFTASRSDKHSTDLAGLRGARMVLASETEEGRAWDEQRVKAITGGDPISARFMHRDFFTYLPQFKPVIYGNYKPNTRNVDDAMRRRLKMVPFEWKPPKVIVNFDQTLIPEYPAILRWMIDGCLAWQEKGLAPPPIVLEATADYFAEQDLIGRWADERCDMGKGYGDTVARLFGDWKAFALANGEEPGSSKRFKAMLEKLPGVRSERSPAGLYRGRGFVGIRIRPHEPERHWQDTDADD